MNNKIILELAPEQYALIMRCLETNRLTHLRNKAIDLFYRLADVHGKPVIRSKHTIQTLEREGKSDEGAVIISDGTVEV